MTDLEYVKKVEEFENREKAIENREKAIAEKREVENNKFDFNFTGVRPKE